MRTYIYVYFYYLSL